jgi:predicted nucleic acid-binding protein
VLIALLDTCVLWPSLQRDFLLSLAFEGMYRPVWSSRILEELEYEEAHKLIKRGGLDSDVAAERAARLVATMRSKFEDAEVSGWEPLVGRYELPDPDDEHVLAAAVIAGAGTLVTTTCRTSPGTRCPLRSTC